VSDGVPGGLAGFLLDHPGEPGEAVVHLIDGSCTLADLQRAARGVAATLAEADVAPDQSVAMVIDTGLEALAVMFGCWIAGGVFIPLNGRLTEREIAAAVEAMRPAVVVGKIEPVDGAGRLAVSGPLTWTVESPADAQAPHSEPGTAFIMRTSGTTGAAKPVVLSHDGVRDGIDTVLGSLRSTSKPRSEPRRAPMPNLIPSNLALWAGTWNALFAFRAGAPVVLMDRFVARDFATLVRRHGIRSGVLAPAMMTMLVEDPDVTDLSPLSMVRSITAPLTPAQARAFRAKFGIGIMNCYGQTELGSEVVGWTPADLREFGESKLGAVGRPHDNVEVRILDEDRHELDVDSVGELWVRSPFVSSAPEIADRLVDGYLQTGDLAHVDADGFLWLDGRMSDQINRGGLKVLPQEIEDVFRQASGVADVCVAAVPDDRLGEVPVAWVRPVPGAELSAEALLEQARTELAGYKVPVAVRVVDDLPRNEIGKVLRTELVATWVAEQTASR
jgi:acyl-CoA synthetase (AMP-forming)/AMP-acid ligase II